MIPAQIDHQAIISDLKGWGWCDFKIEMACGFSSGYIAQLKCGNIQEMGYQKAARLFNFWETQQGMQPLQTRQTIEQEQR